MATVVIDARVVLAWFVPTRTQAEKDFCNGIRTRVFEIGLTIVAPAVFDMEVAGGLLKARRGKLISLAKFTEAREACERLPVEVHAFPYSISRIIDMSIGYHAQAADAMYLHVAQRHAATVITIDGGMAQACQQSKIRFETLKRS